MMQEREYQTRTINAVRKAAAEGSRRILVVSPTGSGKTHIMARFVLGAQSKGNKVLALMHRRGLVDQMIERFSECGIESGCIMAGIDSALDRGCQVASLWTYVRRMQLADKPYNRFFVDAPCVFVDEAHHILSKTYQRVLSEYPNAFVIGVTATPTLSTGAGLGQVFDAMVDVVPTSELIEGGYLVPGVYFGPSEPDLSALKIVQGDYEKRGRDEKLNKPQIIGDVVDNWFKLSSDKQTMVFSINRKHGKALCREFVYRGVKAEYLDAHSDDDDRSDVVGRFRNGDTQVICQVALFTEGTDIPEIESLVIARPTRSLGLHRQILGRGARPRKGKDHFLVLDHGGNCRRLGYYEDPIAWSLDGKPASNKPKERRKGEKTILTCEMCSHLFTGPICPQCGHAIKDYGKKIAALDAELVKLGSSKEKKFTWDEKANFYGMLEFTRRVKGYAEGWVSHQFRRKFGVWPKGFKDMGPIEPDKAFDNWMTYQRIRYSKSKAMKEARQCDQG